MRVERIERRGNRDGGTAKEERREGGTEGGKGGVTHLLCRPAACRHRPASPQAFAPGPWPPQVSVKK